MQLRPNWQIALGGKLTQPVMAGGNLFVADIERCTVYAIDAASGRKRWSHAAGGRVDSPPTYDGGRLLFGSADGYVTSLRASDGALDWRFRAAAIDRRLVAFDRVESVWPVHGSVLVQDGVASAVAGRSMYLDGGLRLCRLDAATGKLLNEKVLDDRDPQTGEDLQVHVRGLNMPVALPDILSSDGERLYMRSQAMDLEGNRLKLGPGGGQDHLFAAYGFTDDSWLHRTYWLFGNGFQGGVGGFGNGRKKPAGRILVHDEETVFGYGRKPSFYRWSSVIDYQLFAAPRSGKPAAPKVDRKKSRRRRTSVAYRWTRDVAMMVRAMALADDVLFVAGPADVLDEEAAFQKYRERAAQRQLEAQDAALAGQRGALLHAVDANTGRTMAEYKIDSPPVFDGLIAASGRLFLCTTDGRVICFAEAR